MCINDVRQELHTLVHTQGVDGLLHLYRRLEKRGRALLAVPVMCRGWMANFGERWAAARTRLPKAAPGFASVIRNSQVQKWRGPRCAAACFRPRHAARRGYAGWNDSLPLQFFDPTIPVEQPAKFTLHINLEIAKVQYLTVPPTLLACADEVIK
jgi:hypothetical protein